VKAARIRVDTELLARALGFPFPWTIVAAQVVYTHWAQPALELVITGESLDACFAVEEGWPIQEGDVRVTFEQRTATITAVHHERS
jgi:hypothetical protein